MATNAPVPITKDDLKTLPILTGSNNYPIWANRMQAFFTHKKLWDVVHRHPGNNPNSRARELLSETAHILMQKIGDRIYNGIITPERMVNGHEIWSKIKRVYGTSTAHNVTRALTRWQNLRFDGNMSTFVDQVESCLAQFDAISHVQGEGAICGAIIAKLSAKRGGLTDSLIMNDSLMGSSELLLEKLKDLSNHDDYTHKDNHVERSITALTNQARTRPVTCKNGVHNPNAAHPESKCWALHPEQRPVRRFNNRPTNPSTPSSNLTTRISDRASEYEKPAFANYTVVQSLSTHTVDLKPVLDTGASHHMFNNVKFLLDATPCHIAISTGRGSEDLFAEQIGTAAVIQDSGKVVLLQEALFVPGLTWNLISIGKLMKDSVRIEKVGNTHVVNIDHLSRFTCSMINGVLEVISSIGPVTASFAAISLNTHSSPTTPFKTWHSRLGHAGIARIKLAIPGEKMEVEGSCDPCMKGKLSRLPFRGHFDPTVAPLQVIHGDIVGPITPSTNSGKRYFLTLIDQHTGYISVTLLKQKSDAMSAFLGFKRFFEKQTGHLIKKLITDGGGEFINKAFAELLDSSGIQHNVSPPYTPQHNGMAERANKTIINMARCMLSQSNLAKEWWGEAVCTAMSVTNCLPSVRRNKVSPIQLMFGKKPNYEVFRPFGCKTWMIKPNHLRLTKFDSVSWDGIVIGYSNDYSGYKVIRLQDRAIIETRHAYFDESVFPSMNALNPSIDHFPHSAMPDFDSEPLFPFQEEDSGSFQDEHHSLLEDEAMELDGDHTANTNTNTVENGDEGEEDQSEEEQEAVPNLPLRRLIIHGPRHPTLVDGSINSANILRYRRRPAAAFNTHTVEPRNHLQAMASHDKAEWAKAEQKEIDNMKAHNVWNEVSARPDIITIPSTWAYKKKLGANNEVIEYKARICAQGFRQTHGLNFDLKYAPTGKPSSLRLLISFSVINDLLIHQLDVKSAFLTCNLDKKVYLTPPAGYLTGANVYLELNKAIYGLKQASLAWYNRLSTFLVKIGFTISIADPCVFWRSSDHTWIFAHVDDLIIFSKNPGTFVKQMTLEFQIKYMGEASFLLGMKLDRVSNALILHQNQYIERKLSEFNLSHLAPSTCPLNPKAHIQSATTNEVSQFAALGVNYRALIGSLNYLSVLTRPDISYSVSKLSQFLERPGINHYRAAVQVFRYLHHTKSRGLLFSKDGSAPLTIAVDADWGNCPDTRRSHTGYISLLNNHVISWKSTKQCTVSLSSTEAEYKALSDAGKESSWLINLCQEIFLDNPVTSAIIQIDNRGAIDLARSQVSQNGFRTKHMDLRLHFIRDLLKSKIISLKYVSSTSNPADFLTKPVGKNNIVRALHPYTSSLLTLCAPRPMAHSMGACQDTVMGPPTDPNYDNFIADAINQIGLDQNTAEALDP
ncbi:hypothetical protein PCANC_01615 [Puccinia coronata f. sp. avenae]|uniref:Integrase catalytic domain-containing protein n=1 Tax=Puccinia coronata f. sp. avenae TaxID=200324 RepID=A0A2N5W0P7_9BASI|nr:hypothetical protein PCANC_01615 [Puccinia coronata f. sp. avenae]